MIHNPNNVLTAGVPLEEATRAMVLVHGRGGSAQDILSLTSYLTNTEGMAFLAPQASGGTWYPYSFLQPTERNEPYLSSALTVLKMLLARLQSDFNFKTPQLYWLGFSQGACLTLEFLAQNPGTYGGIFGLSGGLIGPDGTAREYDGTFGQTPVLLGCSDIDSHIPKARVLETDAVFSRMDANVTTRLYPNAPHSVNEDELTLINTILAS
ncbi:phospholipase/Carboxylesterase [Fibrella aestuarina BUZ 2]|uniref:Phospholipase/Carboxylesterase n=1 Tax=Fibrella aestuarina BUZ 2 TaxID=1166018 RepID=I0K2W6_9BACT|nr:dienelactone hydrolase family protein [Fibrella aestuarina]CCG98469.1 phospholipase/Carboxylesterase [Fibrella aestuarina BUZ 2]